MSVTMRILQQFDATNESAFMELEKEFAELERSRKDFPKGRRFQPIASAEPCNTLIWQCEFPSIEAANATLAFFNGDASHEKLLEKQLPFFRQVKIEFLKNLDF
jgi:hypothetical protein